MGFFILLAYGKISLYIKSFMKKVFIVIVILMIGFILGISYLFSKNKSSFAVPATIDDIQ